MLTITKESLLRGWVGRSRVTDTADTISSSSFQTPKTAGLRPMEKKDIPVVHQLLTRYLKQFHLTPVMSQEEVEHWFYPQENIIDTFVVEVSWKRFLERQPLEAARFPGAKFWHPRLLGPSMFGPLERQEVVGCCSYNHTHLDDTEYCTKPPLVSQASL